MLSQPVTGRLYVRQVDNLSPTRVGRELLRKLDPAATYGWEALGSI